jgi:hypothetical protein
MSTLRRYHNETNGNHTTRAEQSDGSWLLRIEDTIAGSWEQKKYENERECEVAFRAIVDDGIRPDAMESGDVVTARNVAEKPFPGARLPWTVWTNQGSATYWKLDVGAISFFLAVLKDGAIHELKRGLDTRLLRQEDYPLSISEAEVLVCKQMNSLCSAWLGISNAACGRSNGSYQNGIE